MLACLFPGQGAQSEGYLHRLPAQQAVRETLDEASAVLRIDTLTLDTPDALRSTVAVQTGLVVAGVALLRALASERLVAQLYAGLSVGAYAAAVGCGALEFADALRMVRQRAELMERAYPSGYGLSAVTGLSEREVEMLAEAQVDAGMPRVYIANVNAPRQIVVAGSDSALEVFNERARAAGARKAARLAVSVPSHCELLTHAAGALTAYAQHVPFHAPTGVYVGNRGGRLLHTAEAIRDDLATNMRYTVRWFDALTVIVEAGAKVLVEAPPGQVLTDIATAHYPDMVALAASTLAFDRLAATLHKRLGAT